MSLRARLRRAERRADGNLTIATCPVCSEEFRGAGDVALRALAANWAKEAGAERDPDPVVDGILRHPHGALVDALMRTSFPKVASGA